MFRLFSRLSFMWVAALLATVSFAADSPADAVTATAVKGTGHAQLLWLGQSAFRLITPTGKVIVIDPWLVDNPKTPPAYKKLDALGHVDLILVTHAHMDHFADAPALAKLNKAPVWGPAGLDQSMVSLGILPPELAPRMGKGGTIAPFGADGVKITAVHAEHSSELLWKNPDTGKSETHVGGEPVGFIIELENGFRIYHMGDTELFGDMKLIGDRYHPDLVLIPIGGHFVMNPVDAAYAISAWLKPRYVQPMHYGTSAFLKGTPAEFADALGKSPTEVLTMQPGDTHTFE